MLSLFDKEQICQYLRLIDRCRLKASHRLFQMAMPSSVIYTVVSRFHHEQLCWKKEGETCVEGCEKFEKSGIKKGHLVEFLQAQGLAKQALHLPLQDPFEFKFLAYLRNKRLQRVTYLHADYPDMFTKSVLNFIHKAELPNKKRRREEARLSAFLECCLPCPQYLMPENNLAETVNVALESCGLVDLCELTGCCQCKRFRRNEVRVECVVTNFDIAPIVSVVGPDGVYKLP